MFEDTSKIEWINARQRFNPPSKLLPQVDLEVSKVVGKKVFAQDPRLLKLIIKWKQNKPQNSMQPDNFLRDPRKVEELKKALG